MTDNPVNHFPVYEPDAARVSDIEKEFAEENNPLNVHYDASGEVRAKGAGFYQFSADEETRRRQMEELKTAREETGQTRAEFGAVDLKPGEVEGMHGESGGGTSKSAALEKRKRDLEERRKLVDAKRRKRIGDPPVLPNPSLPTEDSQDKAQTSEQSSESGSGKPVALNPADDFLAQLERDIMSGRAR